MIDTHKNVIRYIYQIEHELHYVNEYVNDFLANGADLID